MTRLRIPDLLRRHWLVTASAHIGLLTTTFFAVVGWKQAMAAGLGVGLLFYASISFGNEGYDRLRWSLSEIASEGLRSDLALESIKGILRILMYSFAVLILIGLGVVCLPYAAAFLRLLLPSH